ncbi:hypothetical protein MTsPCn5_16430 [Croceitalea sp. MTPC5]|uniref:hypothetical protein n=1 Tax=Croceitalea sp. MTPC5 TaxID=3056565 RepID=UPI002B3B4E5C|nr:hypothetical protein MTsPCn5_16430 [Croceitalea sp. MTPC5]
MSLRRLVFLVLMATSLSWSQTQPFYNTTAGNGNGYRLWGTNNNYKIHMGNTAEYKYGPVQDYSIKTNMSSGTPNRGWTWGVVGLTPIAALNTSGEFQIAGNLYAMDKIGLGTTNPQNPLEVNTNVSTHALFKGSFTGIQGIQVEREGGDNIRLVANYSGYGGGLESSSKLRFAVSGNSINTPSVVIDQSGRMGVGKTNPQHRIDVEGTINGVLRHKSNYFTLFPYNSTYDDGSHAKTFYDGNRKQIRFWNSDTSTNFTRLETGGLSIGSPNPVSSTNGFENKIEFINGGHGAIVFHPGAADELMFGMHTNGNFYWGRGRSHAQNPSQYSMYLNGINGDLGIRGKLTSDEVKVKIGGWADYVFKENYDLPTLDEVEKHIKEKGHLINIPSAKEVEENGVQLGAMNKLLLEKIEELTLYTIQQQKELESQRKNNQKLNLELERIKKTNQIILEKLETLKDE